ncbi:MAG: tripartite tricarboxylate transporter substrate binding protein [Proteobacteria bacterium]|nr:tripartite tricarboxylate transporter substrate binding protein [Pseudomonadota bacterium]
MNRFTSTRRRAMALTLAALLPLGAVAQDSYPAHSVELIVPYSAGGGVSNMARAFANEAAKLTGQQWVVINREGGGGVVGMTALANAKPDGYTVAFSPGSPITNSPFINSRMPYQSEQIVPVCQVFENVFAVVVREDSPIKSMQDLLAAARKSPGKLAFGHAGPASIAQIAMAEVERSGKLQFNNIAYRGDGAAMSDLLGGTLDFGALAVSSVAGKNLRVLAVLSDRAHPGLPKIPPVTAFGLTATSPGLNGLYVPAGTPPQVIGTLDTVCRKIVGSSDYARVASGMSQTPAYLNGQAFQARLKSAYEENARLVPGLGLQKN